MRSPARQCRSCGRPLRPSDTRITQYPGTVQHVGRGLCKTCHGAARFQFDPLTRTGVELLTEVDLLAGYPPSEVARRLGVTVAAIARAAYRHGRPDVGRRFCRVEPGVAA